MKNKKAILLAITALIIIDFVILINFLDYERFEVNHIIYDSYNWEEEKQDEGLLRQEIVDNRVGFDFWSKEDANNIATLLTSYTSDLKNMEFENLLEKNTDIKRVETKVLYAWVSGLDSNEEYQSYYEVWVVGVADEYSYNWILLLVLGSSNFIIITTLIVQGYMPTLEKEEKQ